MENSLKKILVKFGTQLYFGWVLFIGILTLIPGAVISGVDWNFLSIDKIIHFMMFLGLTFLGTNFFVNTRKPLNITSALIISFLIAIIYGSLIEYTQTFIPERGFDYADLTANIAGTLTGAAVYYFYFTRRT